MINIQVPEIKEKMPCSDYLKLTKEAGIYFFYGPNEELLYIGKTTNIYQRILSHICGSSNLKDVYHNFKKISYFVVDDPVERDIYEVFLINKLKPLLNVDKTYTYATSRYLKEYNPTYFHKEKTKQKQISEVLENFRI